MYKRWMISALFLMLAGCASVPPPEPPITPVKETAAPREFRAAWVASVANINWPSRPGLPTSQQKREAVYLLDLLEKHNFNAVVMQVRPQCDALYRSDLEPWSYYLTGVQGQAPEPYYDPLEFWIEEAHKRGLEFHAWLNPYRAHHVSGGDVTKTSIVRKRPDLALRLKSGYWWLDPANPGTQDHSISVVMDIVRRYDVDGIHMDDYFYPYPSYNDNEDFPDDASWSMYVKGGGELSRNDWRRHNVNIFIQRLYDEIKREKMHVKFGLSPFGIWRPNYPESIRGFDQYDKLYADARLWLNKGWIDYWTPQLYWPINQIPQSYPVLLGWWIGENEMDRHVWPGINVGRWDGEKGIDETINQIMVTRGMRPDAPGTVHWSIAPMVKSTKLRTAISDGPYKNKALVPASPWLDSSPPAAPKVSYDQKDQDVMIEWSHPDKRDVRQWVVYYKYEDAWQYKIVPGVRSSVIIPSFTARSTSASAAESKDPDDLLALVEPLRHVMVTAVDRTGNESSPARITTRGVEMPQKSFIEKMLTAQSEKRDARKARGNAPLVTPGIEVLVQDSLHLVRGKRIGLVTNPSAVGSDLRSDIDILAGTPGVNLVALFGAEHGVRGAKQGRIMKEGEPDPVTGIPLYSLYGDSYAPKRQWLENLDALVFDIQGVGSAWYTFKYSMSFAMEACAEAGIPFIVLDRPNPLGGSVVEGPLLDLKRIFRHPLPLRHGMTYGELATMWNEEHDFGADLKVVRMHGWRREYTWDDTGLFWVMPSPNMGTLETAIVYPGQCLFERMNISEGRGTTKPFLLTGAPWIDCEKAANDLNNRGIPGAIFRPVYFIPRIDKTTRNPRSKPWNEMCAGVEIMLTDFKAYRSVEAALHIIDAYRQTSPGSLDWSPPATIRMLNQDGVTVKEVIDACQKEVAEFKEIRKKYLLY